MLNTAIVAVIILIFVYFAMNPDKLPQALKRKEQTDESEP